MRLSKITIEGFRCFGTDVPVSVSFEELTAFVGANGAGKTAVLMALVRMFGTTRSQRLLTKDDFHIPSSSAEPTELALRIEARFEFPELTDDGLAMVSSALPECLRHILVSDSVGIPYCRIRLDGRWTKTATAEGEIEESLSWIDSADDTPPADKVSKLGNVERALIRVFYVPATRDAAHELRAVSGTVLTGLLRRIAWSPGLRDRVAQLATDLTSAMRSEPALSLLEELLQGHWASLRGSSREVPTLSFSDADVESVLRRLDAHVAVPGRAPRPIELLSEGERSLMYFSLVQTVFGFEARATANPDKGLTDSDALVPVLTILAVEEPENHLAPQYLSRILRSLRSLVDEGAVQGIITSHSASLMRRIEPQEVRYFRTSGRGRSIVPLSLPSDTDEAFKYVRQAVQAHPELYFASVVVLCEGASEEVALPRLARAFDLDIDPKFVAVVPLGGRHVHHFWRLLKELGTPYATLVDLDLERQHGGWARIHYLLTQLEALGANQASTRESLLPDEFAEMPTWAAEPLKDGSALADWVKFLEDDYHVFLSAPLDFDYLMLRAFESVFIKMVPKGGGPRIPNEDDARKDRLDRATRAVLGSEGGSGETYGDEGRRLFPWHAYHFGASKPTTHARLFAELDDNTIQQACPAVVKRLIDLAKQRSAE